MSNIAKYLDLIAAAMNVPSIENIEAIEDFEAENPDIIDAAYQAGQLAA